MKTTGDVLHGREISVESWVGPYIVAIAAVIIRKGVTRSTDLILASGN